MARGINADGAGHAPAVAARDDVHRTVTALGKPFNQGDGGRGFASAASVEVADADHRDFCGVARCLQAAGGGCSINSAQG